MFLMNYLIIGTSKRISIVFILMERKIMETEIITRILCCVLSVALFFWLPGIFITIALHGKGDKDGD